MNKLVLALAAAVALVASGIADAQGRPGGGGGRGGGGGGPPGMGSGNSSYGGARSFAGNSYRGGYGGSGVRGGYSGGGVRGGYAGAGYRGAYWGGGRHGYWPGYRPGYGGGYWGGYWGPSIGFYIGGPTYWGAWGYPYYAPSTWVTTPIVIEQESTVYTQAQAQEGAASANYWYYCTEPAGYYPYVQSCTKAWIPVVPQPVPPPAG